MLKPTKKREKKMDLKKGQTRGPYGIKKNEGRGKETRARITGKN